MTLIVTFGQRKWNWPRAIGPLGSNGPDRRSRTARTGSRRGGSPRGGTRPPRRRRPSRTRVRDLAVVALEEVLAADLPVRLVAGARAAEEAKRVDVEARVGDERGQLAQRLGERGRLPVGVDEHERSPGVDARAAGGRARSGRSPPPGPTAAPRATTRRARTSRRGRGTASVSRRPSPSQTSEPRWRQTLRNARSVPSRSRTTTIGIAARIAGEERAGLGAWSACPAYCHARRKTRSRSSRRTAGSVYQSQGSVRLSATVAMIRL